MHALRVSENMPTRPRAVSQVSHCAPVVPTMRPTTGSTVSQTHQMQTNQIVQIVVGTLCGAALAAACAAALVVWSGIYPVSATREHFQSVYGLLETTMRRSVQRHARDVQVPDLAQPARVARGAACYRLHCEQCHGGPGVAQGPIGRGMQPLPGPLADARQRWELREIYWITRHGIRMSGMPAWEFRLPEEDLWSLTAFLVRLPALGPADYAAATRREGEACEPSDAWRDAPPARAPDPQRGRMALSQYACSACHTIPGVTGSAPQVGPPLDGLARRPHIAGYLRNTPDNMVRWLRAPQAVDPRTAMPDLGVTEADARDMAAYLATLH